MSQAMAADARPGDVAKMKQIAERLGKSNPRWIVVSGEYTKQFVAFPRFPVPKGTVVAAHYPAPLPARMRAVESRALPGSVAIAALGCQAISLPSEGRSSDVAGR